MAILSKIRNQTGLLLGVTALGLLAFLVPWESVSGLFSSSKDPNVLGKVNGVPISSQEYYSNLDLLSDQAQGQYPKALLEAQNWQTIVSNKLIEQKFKSAGLLLTDKMIWDVAKYNPMFANSPKFKDKNGQVSTQLIGDFYRTLEENQHEEQYREQYSFYDALKRNFAYQAMYKIYFGTLGSGFMTNKKEIDILADNNFNVSNIEYIKIDYNEYQKLYPVKVTDEEIQTHIEKHKSVFKVEENRTLDYVSFSSKPTPEDEKTTLAELNKLLSNTIIDGDTIQAFNAVKNDSAYIVDLNANQIIDRSFNPLFRDDKQFPSSIQNWVKEASVGQISSLYQEDGYYLYSKLIGKKNSDTVKAQTIVLTYTGANPQLQPKKPRTKEEAKKLADELKAKLTANSADFAKLALENSDDPAIAENKGALTFLTGQDLDRSYKILQNFFENSTIGSTEVIETPEGFMVINMTDRKFSGILYRTADLAKKINASNQTTEKARTDAIKFIQSVQGKSSKEFQDLAKKNNYNPLQQAGVQQFGSMLNGLESDKESDIINWAFDPKRKLGDTENFISGDQSYIVVRVSSLFDKGLAHPSTVRKELEPVIRNEKLGKIIAEKVNTSKKSLDQLAAEYKTTKQGTSINFTNSMINSTFEPKVGGAAFGLKDGAQSKAIEGREGVYVIVKKSVTKGQSIDKKDLRTRISDEYSQQIPRYILNTMYLDANVDDFRGQILSQANKARP